MLPTIDVAFQLAMTWNGAADSKAESGLILEPGRFLSLADENGSVCSELDFIWKDQMPMLNRTCKQDF